MTAFDHKRAWKKRAVRVVAEFWGIRQYAHSCGMSCKTGGKKGTYREAELVNRLAGDTHSQEGVAENPKGDETSTETLVRILQGLLIMLNGSNKGCQGALDGRLELTVDIGLRFIDFLNDCILAAFVLGGLGRGQRISLVRTLGTPRHIVPVAEGIDVEDVDVGGLQDHVGRERGEHVPRVGVHERGDKVQTERGSQGDDNDTGTRRREERLEELSNAFVGYEIHRCASSKGANHQVQRIHDNVHLDDAEDDKGCQVGELGTLGAITESEDELKQQEAEVDVLDDSVDDGSGIITEGERPFVVAIGGSTDQVNNDSGGQPVGGQREPGENSVKNVVQHLNVQEEHANDVVTRLIHPAEMHE